MPQFSAFGRYLSILDRLMRMYYDHGLSGFEIGWGQQFYVEYLYDHPGASAQEMAACIRVDKATLTKTIQKLTQVGYVRAAADERDRRVKHLYLTDKAVPAAQRIKQIHAAFYDVLSAGLSPAEIAQAEGVLQRMTENLSATVRHRMGGREHEDQR